jgi:hypothetical protein
MSNFTSIEHDPNVWHRRYVTSLLRKITPPVDELGYRIAKRAEAEGNGRRQKNRWRWPMQRTRPRLRGAEQPDVSVLCAALDQWAPRDQWLASGLRPCPRPIATPTDMTKSIRFREPTPIHSIFNWFKFPIFLFITYETFNLKIPGMQLPNPGVSGLRKCLGFGIWIPSSNDYWVCILRL